eukprot:7033777-Prymnesium_polylepis.1
MLVCSTQLFSRSHTRKHPVDPPEHLERSVGLRPSGGAADALARLFCNVTGGTEGVLKYAVRPGRGYAHKPKEKCQKQYFDT